MLSARGAKHELPQRPGVKTKLGQDPAATATTVPAEFAHYIGGGSMSEEAIEMKEKMEEGNKMVEPLL